MRRLGLACLLAVFLYSSALGAEQTPFDLYRAGKYEEAIAAGEATKTGNGLAVAARAAFAEANLSDKPCLPCLKRVEDLARRSIALDSAHPEAFIYLAAAVGFEARIIGNVRAQFARIPETAKAAIDHALDVAPNDDWSLAAAGAWNIEIVRNGGSVLARAVYGARLDTGLDYFARAFAAEPKNLVIRFQYALSLSGYDFETYQKDIAVMLASVGGIEPRTAYESVIKQRAANMLAMIKAGKLREYMALVSHYQGYS